MNMTEIKIPCVAVGSKTEQLIRDAVEVTGENKGKLKSPIFSTVSQLERGSNKFNASLYKSILNYGASEKHFPNGAWIPSTEELLEIFNRAYHIATIAINTEVPLDRYGDFWDMASIWIELDPETAAWEGYSHQRNLSALYAIYAMVHAIVDREKDKSEFIEDFLDTIRTDETINEAMEFFLPADKQPNTTATPPSSTTETETETETEEEVKTTPPNHSYTEEEQKSIAKVLRQEINEYIIEKLKECIELCESHADYTLLEIALYENNYIKKRNSHQAFIKAMIALHLLEDGSVKIDNVKQKFSSLGKSNATSGMYKTWDTNNTDRIKCEKFAEILNT